MTTYGTGSIAADSVIAKAVQQEETLYRLMKKKTLIGKLSSGKMAAKDGVLNSGAGSPIQEKLKLEGKKQKGGKMQFRLIDRLKEDGVEGDTTLSGTGEELDMYEQNLTLELSRKAVRVDDLSAQFAIDNLEEEHKTALEIWGVEKVDKKVIDAYVTNPTSVFYKEAGDIKYTPTPATALAAITAADKISPDLMQYLATYAGTGGTGTDRRFKKIMPIADKGNGVKYIFLAHPHMLYDLKRNAEYRQECRERANLASSESMKTFWTDAVAMIDNVVIFEHEDIPLYTNANGVVVCKGIFMGAQSLAFAWGRRPYYTAEESDHGKKKEVGWNIIMKAQKFKFNDIDMNSVGVYVAQTDIAG